MVDEKAEAESPAEGLAFGVFFISDEHRVLADGWISLCALSLRLSDPAFQRYEGHIARIRDRVVSGTTGSQSHTTDPREPHRSCEFASVHAG